MQEKNEGYKYPRMERIEHRRGEGRKGEEKKMQSWTDRKTQRKMKKGHNKGRMKSRTQYLKTEIRI